MHKKKILTVMLVASLVSSSLNGLGINATSTTTKYYKTTKTYTFKDKKGIKKIVVNNKKKKIKAGAKSYKLKMTKAGKYRISIVNKKGKTKKYVIYIDKKKPVVTGIKNGNTYQGIVYFRATDNTKVKSIKLDGKKKSTKKSYLSVKNIGEHTLIVTDMAGNIKKVRFTIAGKADNNPISIVTATPTVLPTNIPTTQLPTPTSTVTATPSTKPSSTMPTTTSVIPTPTEEPIHSATPVPASSMPKKTKEPNITPGPTVTTSPTVTPTITPVATVEPNDEMTGSINELEDIVDMNDSLKGNYSIDEEDGTVTLKTVNPNKTEITIYPSYNIGGKNYKTTFDVVKVPEYRETYHYQVGPFGNNCNIEQVNFKGFDFSNSSMSYMFNGCTNLKKVTGIKGKNINLSYTFGYCENLEEVDIEENTTFLALKGSFSGCKNLDKINGELIGVNKADMNSCFYNCKKIEKIKFSGDIDNLSTTFMNCENLNCSMEIPDSVTDASSAFMNCYSLITMPTINKTSKLTNTQMMFLNCKHLRGGIVYLGYVDAENTKCNGMFFGCESIGLKPLNIYVPYKLKADALFNSENSLNKEDSSITISAQGYYDNTENLYIAWRDKNEKANIGIYTSIY